MGQYYVVCNLDRKEYASPSDFGDFIKLMEFGQSSRGTLSALTGLLAMNSQQSGSWAGCRLVVAGDYADEGRFVPPEYSQSNLYSYCSGDAESDAERDARKQAEAEGKEPPEVSSENKPPAPYCALTAAEGMAQLRAQGISLEISSGIGREPEMLDALVGKKRVYDQPEELFEALYCTVQEDWIQMGRGLLTSLRMASLPSELSWCQVENVQMAIDDVTGRAYSLTMTLSERGSHGRPARSPFTCELEFPATVAAVRKFLKLSPEIVRRLSAHTPQTALEDTLKPSTTTRPDLVLGSSSAT